MCLDLNEEERRVEEERLIEKLRIGDCGVPDNCRTRCFRSDRRPIEKRGAKGMMETEYDSRCAGNESFHLLSEESSSVTTLCSHSSPTTPDKILDFFVE